jgi:hypothetical protein
MDQTSESEKIYQRSKYEEIIEILLGAGYFRARINTLSEFDKVVGGLCWCIVSSGEVVDVDILFQENSTIGQKIALSEAIVKTLRKMGCPAPLQPHQIQGGVGGSDYPAIHLVMVWLVKKYFERRGEREEQLRAYSTFQFSKNYSLPLELEGREMSDSFAKILNRNKATRLYRRKETAGESEETRVRSCLLEYGETFSVPGSGADGASGTGKSSHVAHGSAGAAAGGAGSSAGDTASAATAGGFAASAAAAAANRASKQAAQQDAKSGGAGAGAAGGAPTGGVGPVSMDVTLAGLARLDVTELSAFEKQLAKAAREAKKEEALFAAQLSQEEAQLRSQMKQLDEGAGAALSGSQVGNIVGLGLGEMGSALAAYQAELEESRKQLDSSLASGKLGQQAAFNRQKQNLLKQRDELSAKEREVKIASTAMMQKLSLIEEERDGALEYIGQLKAQLKKLGDLESASSQQEELRVVQDLVAKNEALRGEEAAFKAKCKAQRQEYIDRIAALEAELAEDTEENAKLRDVEDMHAKVSGACWTVALHGFLLVHSLRQKLLWTVWFINVSSWCRSSQSTTSCDSCWRRRTWRWPTPCAPSTTCPPARSSSSTSVASSSSTSRCVFTVYILVSSCVQPSR